MSSHALSADLIERARQGRGAATSVLAQALSVPEREAAASLAHQFGMPYFETLHLQQREPAFDRLPLARAQQRRAVLLHALPEDVGVAYVAVVPDPFDRDLQLQIEEWAAAPLRMALATPDDIHAYLNQQEAKSKAMETLAEVSSGEAGDKEATEVLSLAALSEAQSPAVRLLNSTLYDALRAGASDVHLEATAAGLVIKYRIDGVLDAVAQPPGRQLAEQVISRLKVLSDLDIGERRVPQDGSFRVMAQERPIDLRVSVMPSVHGEDAVIRILDKQAVIEAHGRLTLEGLGFAAETLVTLRDLIEAPYGLLLVTGPTGSGKTTTLYAALSETHTGRDKIITIEDPVEYHLAGVLQIPVNEKKGLTFARGLRSILRHDPDKIMVGEIRDRDTAEIAVQSALTGHMVLSTVHANNVFDVFGRFMHMGLDPYALASALNGIWAQRLLRVNCQHCTQPYQPDAQDLRRFDLDAGELAGYRFMRGMGCGDCRGTGYRGRLAVAEVLRLDDELREMVAAKEPIRRLKEAARQRGTRSLMEAALDLVRQGKTTLEEVRRVTMAA
ncbi:MAG TPA: GspE/PulE family protein [Rhizobacter sp.]|nr:GspE/PulE family protein [Rhizobacter sp.]